MTMRNVFRGTLTLSLLLAFLAAGCMRGPDGPLGPDEDNDEDDGQVDDDDQGEPNTMAAFPGVSFLLG